MKSLSPSELKVLAILKIDGPLTRPEITERSGFSKETVWRVTKSLVECGLAKQISDAKHIGGQGMTGAIYATTEKQLPADVLSNVVHEWVKAA